MENNKTIIYYNPKCSKCRTTLNLLNKNDASPTIIEYLNDIPSKSELKNIISKLGIPANMLLRKKEPAYQLADLNETSTDDEILEAMIKFPILIERPIVIHNDKAVLGRPPGKVLELL